MKTRPDPESKSIVLLVRSLIITTVIILILILAGVYYIASPAFVGAAREPEPFYCGVIDNSPPAVLYNGKDGKLLFKAKCSSCHSLTDKGVAAPGLRGVLSRIPAGYWRYTFIRDQDSLLDAGDPYTVHLRNTYRQRCTPFPSLTDEEIDAILMYASGGGMVKTGS